MNPARRTTPLTIALYLNAALLAVIAMTLWSRPGAPQFLPLAAGQTQAPIAGGAGVFIVPAQFAGNLWGCYLMDVDTQSLCAYQYLPGDHQLRLMAARNFRWDRHLGNYNTANPSPAEVKDLVDKEQAGAPRRTRKAITNRSHTMMAKMFYTLDETKAALAKNEEDIKQLTREGRLREFRDGPRLMFKADQVEQLKAELGGGSLDHVDLGPSDSGAPIGLVDSRGATGSGVGVQLTDVDASSMSGSGMQMQMKDDTALAGDLGLSGSVGGVPSPGRMSGGSMSGGSMSGGSLSGGSMAGGSMPGTGLTGSLSGTASGSRHGINVFTADDSIEHADPGAQTAITPSDQVNLDGVGSGSGLLDLTRESDDTSLGAELLDEIAPGKGAKRGRAADSGIAAAEAGSDRRIVTPPPIYVETPDAFAPALGGAALAASLFALIGGLVVTSAVLGARPSMIDLVAGKPMENRSIWIIFAIGAAAAVVFGLVGLVAGKRR